MKSVLPLLAVFFLLSPGLHAQITATGDVLPTPPVNPAWNVSFLTVGDNTTGNLTLASGGTLTSVFTFMARRAGSTGTVDVTGGNWTNREGIGVGHVGSATLNISGGRIESRYVALGSTATGNGTLNMTGGDLVATPLDDVFARSDLLDGAIQVGSNNSGTMTLSGGNVRSDRVFVGLGAGSIGEVTVSGGVWDSSAALVGNTQPDILYVGGVFVGYDRPGYGGVGTFNLTGGRVIANDFYLGSAGSVANLSGGEMNLITPGVVPDIAVIDVDSSTTLNLSGTAVLTSALATVAGTLNITGGSLTLTPSEWSSPIDGASLLVSGAMTMSGGQATMTTLRVNLGGIADISGGTLTTPRIRMLSGTFNLNGGVAKTGEFLGPGTINLNGGTLQILGNQGALFGSNLDTVNIGAAGATIDTQSFTVGNGRTLVGPGGLTKLGNGTLALAGNNTYAGPTVITDGAFVVNGSLASSSVSMGNGTTLSGNGTLAGPVTLGSNVTINPGNGVGTLTTGDLTLNSSTILNFGLGPVAASDRIAVSGNLTLDGTLNIADLIGFGAGTYRLFDYTGSLIDNGLLFGILPGAYDLSLSTTTANEINLLVTASPAQYWDGPNTTPQGIPEGSGGSGTWSASSTNWTNASGLANAAWSGLSSAVFGAANGTVTIADGFTATTPKITFATDGYTLAAAGNGSLSLTDSGIVNVANGTATISAPVTGSSRIEKQGPGTLVLSGNNTYSNATWIREGTLNLTGSISHPMEDLAVGRYFGDLGIFLLSGNASLTNRTGFLGVDAGSTGTVTMSGGTWNNSDELRVGDYGTGTLTISGGSITSTIGNIARSFGSTGNVTMSGGNWTNSIEFVVGNRGIGTFTLNNGTLSSIISTIGLNEGGTGNATINGGTWSNSDELRVGEFGAGHLTITGGNITSTIGNIARSGGSSGTVTMTGGSWTNSAEFVVGNRGIGTFTLTNGELSSVVSTIGLNDGGTGNATVTGGTWANSSELRVGDSGSGRLHISGGNITSTIGNIARNGGSFGEVTMSDGTWTNSSIYVVGNAGQGSLNQSGGQITGTDGEIGYNAGGVGVATLSGGTWTNTGNLTIGRAGQGTLNSLAGSTVDVQGGTVYVAWESGSAGTMNFGSSDLDSPTAPGTVNAGAFVFGDGDGRIQFNQPGAFSFSTPTSGPGSLVQRGNGTTTITGTHTYSGDTMVTRGTLVVDGALTASLVTVASGGTLGGSGTLKNLRLEAGGSVAPGNSIGTLASESFTWQAGGELLYELGNGISDLIDLSGAFTMLDVGTFHFTFLDAGWQVGQTYTLVEFDSTDFTVGHFGFTNTGGFDGDFALGANTLTFTLTAIPEPGAMALLLLAGGLLALHTGKRPAKNAKQTK